MGSAPSLQDLRAKIAGLTDKPILENAGLLKEVGVYFLFFEPISIDPEYVREFASRLNDLYVQMATTNYSAEDTNNILEVLGKISTQSHKIRTNTLDDEYFKNFKKLGLALIAIGDQWANKTDPTKQSS